jgi:hypothetical protein
VYEYVRRTYGTNPIVGQRVRHTITGNEGTIAPEGMTHAHYVRVRFVFDGRDVILPCHPKELVDVEASIPRVCGITLGMGGPLGPLSNRSDAKS